MGLSALCVCVCECAVAHFCCMYYMTYILYVGVLACYSSLLFLLRPCSCVNIYSCPLLPSSLFFVVFHGLVHRLCWHKCCFSLPVICTVSQGYKVPWMCRKYVFACVQHLCECLRHTCVWAREHALVDVHIVWACMQVIVVICKHTSWPQSVCLATYSAWVFVHASLCKRVCVSANIISFFFQKYFLHIKLWSGNLKTK